MNERTTCAVAELLGTFEGYLARNGRALGTRAKYLQDLEPFAGWLGERSPGSLRRPDLEVYLNQWWQDFEGRQGRSPSLGSYRAKITALKAFFSYLESFELLVDDEGRTVPNRAAHIATPRIDPKPIDWLKPGEDEALLSASGTPNENILIWLLRFTGLRVEEARSLCVDDLNLSPGAEELRVRVSKTYAGHRTVPLAPELVLRIVRWLERLDALGVHRPEGPLLATSKGTPMFASYIWRAVKRAAFKAGVRPVPCTCGASRTAWHDSDCPRTASGEHLSEISPHTLRRTFGSDLINRGMPIEGVSKLLGHSSVAVTQRYYAELLDETVRRDYLRALGYRRAA